MADSFTEADGRQLAVDMMRELHLEWKQVDLSDVPDGHDTVELMIAREPETMRRYLRTVQGKASPALERGFLCVLTDFIGSVLDGTGMDAEAYEAHEERGQAQS